MPRQASKVAAARRAVEFVQDGMLVGLGTGSTSEEMVRLLAERKADVEVVTTSEHILRLARSLDLRVQTDFPDFTAVDLTMDGADEVDPQGFMIKGGGGALLREKLVASASARVVIMVDESKHVTQLGTTRPVPVEVVPFGWGALVERLRALGGRPVRREVEGKPFRTDHGNWIFDVDFGGIADPATLHGQIKSLAGVVETGIFLNLCSLLVTGAEDGSTVVTEFARK